MSGYVKRTKQALDELTDKTLPEEQQMKILNVMTRYYDRYSQVKAINSHRSGDFLRVDLHLSFENNTSCEEIVKLKKQMQEDLEKQMGQCIVNVVVESDQDT